MTVSGVGAGSKARRAPFSSPCCVISTTTSSNSVGPMATSGPVASVSSEMLPGSTGSGMA